jgi:hypothetical protein
VRPGDEIGELSGDAGSLAHAHLSTPVRGHYSRQGRQRHISD